MHRPKQAPEGLPAHKQGHDESKHSVAGGQVGAQLFSLPLLFTSTALQDPARIAATMV